MRDTSEHDERGSYTFGNMEVDVEGQGKEGLLQRQKYTVKCFLTGTAVMITIVIALVIALSVAYAVYIKGVVPRASTGKIPFYSNVTVYYASSLNDIMIETINPSFEAKYNIRVNAVSDSSGNLAKALKLGKAADVFISADSKISATLLAPVVLPGTTIPVISWYTFWASTNLGIGYNINSTYVSTFEKIANGSLPWYEGLNQATMKIGRTDPDSDPKGT